MAVLLLAEHDGATVSEASAKALTAAAPLGADVHVLVAGGGSGGAAEHASKLAGVAKVLHLDDDAYSVRLAETYAALIADLAGSYDHVVAAATASGKNIMARVAGLLDVMILSDVTEIISADTFERPIYAGNAIMTVKSNDATKVVTVRTATFQAAAEGGSAAIEAISAGANPGLSEFVSEDKEQSDRPQLTSAKIVVSGGRAMGSADNFAIIDRLAEKLNAAVGASRAAVDSGYAPNDYQVGQTGKVVAPDLYIAVGISGAIQHLAGMKDSKIIVAINKDEEAPIFQVADYGLVADLFDAVPELEKALAEAG
ncbi:MAG: FAD-binding protein [Pseudomonadota bacterium]